MLLLLLMAVFGRGARLILHRMSPAAGAAVCVADLCRDDDESVFDNRNDGKTSLPQESVQRGLSFIWLKERELESVPSSRGPDLPWLLRRYNTRHCICNLSALIFILAKSISLDTDGYTALEVTSYRMFHLDRNLIKIKTALNDNRSISGSHAIKCAKPYQIASKAGPVPAKEKDRSKAMDQRPETAPGRLPQY